jgi:DNA repair protein RecN (Recombination protein N)
MLKELKIEGFKLLRDIEIHPHEGFNVITGETGAGKSLVLGALKFLLGAKGGDELFTKGKDNVSISATFQISDSSPLKNKLVSEGFIEKDEDEIHIERLKQKDGKSKLFLGGRRANLPIIRFLQESMVDFLQQDKTSRIIDRSALDVLDSIGDEKHQNTLKQHSETFRQWQNLNNAIKEHEERIRSLSERRDLMEFQLRELKEAELAVDEPDNLNRELQLLSGASELRENAIRAQEYLVAENSLDTSAYDHLTQAIELIKPLADIESEFQSRLDELVSAQQLIQETAKELHSKAASIQDDPKRLKEVEERISLIEKLKRKYHRELNELIALRDNLARDVALIQFGDDDLNKLKTEFAEISNQLKDKTAKLSQSRKKLAKQTEKELIKHLTDLDLPNGKVAFDFKKKPDNAPSANGCDIVELLLSTNKAEEMRPLNVIASGGEAARITLALKALWAEREGVPVMVLDEADMGIGGDTAYRIGEKFKELSKSHQLIIVSHLAQVASFAHRHFRAVKSETAKDTGIEISELRQDERVEELARMLAGSKDTESSIALAKSLLDNRHLTGEKITV